MKHKPPFVVATVLNYNGWKDAAECVQSLLSSSYPNLKVIIVDNCSTDDSVVELSRLADGQKVELLQTGANLGSVGGTNFAVRRALRTNADFILALSNDLVVSSDAISTLVETMQKEPAVGVMSTRIMYYDEPAKIWSCGFLMNSWLARGTDLIRRLADRPNEDRLLDVDLLVGCVMFFRRELLEDVGLMDERYFYQNEEYEFFDRVRKAGWLVKVAMRPYVLHKIGQTIGTQSYDRWYYGTRNRLLYIKENLSQLQRITAKSFFYGTRPVKFAQWLLKGRADLVKATFDGWRDYRRLRLGKRLSTEGVV